MRYTIDEFAEKVKNKYPAYENIDNQILVEEVLKKYPVYKKYVIPQLKYTELREPRPKTPILREEKPGDRKYIYPIPPEQEIAFAAERLLKPSLEKLPKQPENLAVIKPETFKKYRVPFAETLSSLTDPTIWMAGEALAPFIGAGFRVLGKMIKPVVDAAGKYTIKPIMEYLAKRAESKAFRQAVLGLPEKISKTEARRMLLPEAKEISKKEARRMLLPEAEEIVPKKILSLKEIRKPELPSHKLLGEPPPSQEFPQIVKLSEANAFQQLVPKVKEAVEITAKVEPAKEKVAKALRKRYGEIQANKLLSFRFTNGLTKRLTKLEREAIPFLREKTLVPKELNRQDLEMLVKKPTKKLLSAAKDVSEYLDEAHRELISSYGDDVGFVKDYIPHIWDIPKSRMPEVVNWFTTLNPHTKKRFLATLAEGIKKGYKPKTLDIAETISRYDDIRIKAIANKRFIDFLKTATDNMGVPLLAKEETAPVSWETINNPVLRRAFKSPVRVNPEIAKEVNAVLAKPFNFEALRGTLTINAFLKKSQLSLSLFHHCALTEVGTVTIPQKTISLLNPLKMIKVLAKKDYPLLEEFPIALDGVRHGLVLGAISDIQRGIVDKTLDNIVLRTKTIPVINKLTKGITAANKIWDRALWDYYHNSLKIYTYEALTQRYLKKFPQIPADLIKDEVATITNDIYGGQAWDLLLKSKNWQNAMHLVLLSPDWTYSTARQALSPFGVGAVHSETKFLRKKIGRIFWAKAVLYYYSGINMLNYALTKEILGKGRFMWDNEPGHKTHLFIGKNPDGTNKYLRWGKQFRELPEFVLGDPIKKMASKASPILHEAIIQTTGRTFTGWKTPIAGKGFYESLPERFAELAKAPTPFSAKQMLRRKEISPLMLAFPISKGMSPYKAREYYKKAFEKNSVKDIEKIIRFELENNLEPLKDMKSAIIALKSDYRQKLKEKYSIKDWKKAPLKVKREFNIFGRKLDILYNRSKYLVGKIRREQKR